MGHMDDEREEKVTQLLGGLIREATVKTTFARVVRGATDPGTIAADQCLPVLRQPVNVTPDCTRMLDSLKADINARRRKLAPRGSNDPVSSQGARVRWHATPSHVPMAHLGQGSSLFKRHSMGVAAQPPLLCCHNSALVSVCLVWCPRQPLIPPVLSSRHCPVQTGIASSGPPLSVHHADVCTVPGRKPGVAWRGAGQDQL